MHLCEIICKTINSIQSFAKGGQFPLQLCVCFADALVQYISHKIVYDWREVNNRNVLQRGAITAQLLRHWVLAHVNGFSIGLTAPLLMLRSHVRCAITQRDPKLTSHSYRVERICTVRQNNLFNRLIRVKCLYQPLDNIPRGKGGFHPPRLRVVGAFTVDGTTGSWLC